MIRLSGYITVVLLLITHGAFCYELLTLNTLRKISQIDTERLSLNENDENNHFKHLNRTRIPGSSGSLYVQNYIISHFTDMNSKSSINWDIETDNFKENGFNFTNIVTKKSPPGLQNPKYLVLAVHYDSLIKPEGFIGAIDSAISCGILLDIAQTLSSIIDEAFENDQTDLGLKFVFFDGEEAIEKWTADDSIYGSKNLHSKWAKNGDLQSIELFVLLDLLGAKDRNYIPSYFPNTHDSYNDISHLEDRLRQLRPELFETSSKFFSAQSDSFPSEVRGYIEDDHIPFMKSGVPVLHLIPHVFPKIWHTIDDDFNHVDLTAIKRWNVLLRSFVLEYLDIDEVKIH